MKRILLTSTASVFALAGAAAAEIAFSGNAALGYNDTLTPIVDELPLLVDSENDGFYWDGELIVSLTQELDNGLTAGVTFDIDFSDNNLGEDLFSDSYVLSLTGDGFGLFFGDTQFAAFSKWSSAGYMLGDSFSEQDGETVLRGDATFGDFSGSVSYAIADADGTTVGDAGGDDLEQLSVGMNGSFGAISFGAAYQEETDFPFAGNGDFNTEEVFGVFVGGSFAGADVRLAYAEDDDARSTGIRASYPVGPVTLTAFYVFEDSDVPADDDASFGGSVTYVSGPISAVVGYEDRADSGVRYNIEGSYEVGNGLTAHAGYLDRDVFDDAVYYVAAEYDLGGGATFLVSYADADDASAGFIEDDEVGRNEYQIGTTVEVSFQF